MSFRNHSGKLHKNIRMVFNTRTVQSIQHLSIKQLFIQICGVKKKKINFNKLILLIVFESFVISWCDNREGEQLDY